MKTNDENYNLLAKEIVIKGVDDYKTALKELWALEKKLIFVKSMLTDCEKFFESQWCEELSGINDPTYIKNNAFDTAKREYENDDIVTVSIKIKPKKKTKVEE